jgi:hypothetical protein
MGIWGQNYQVWAYNVFDAADDWGVLRERAIDPNVQLPWCRLCPYRICVGRVMTKIVRLLVVFGYHVSCTGRGICFPWGFDWAYRDIISGYSLSMENVSSTTLQAPTSGSNSRNLVN